MDIAGMRCTCGKQLVKDGIDNGCQVLKCPKCEGKSYRITIEDPRKLPFPWEILRVKVYTCRDCGTEITEEQAKMKKDCNKCPNKDQKYFPCQPKNLSKQKKLC